MVKGISKQVILVRPQEEALFEQAIFIVRDGVADVTEKDLLRQAQAAANPEHVAPGRWQSAVLGFLGGGGTVALLWFMSLML